MAQIVLVETGEFGPLGPIKWVFAVGLDEPDAAVEAVSKRLKRPGRARWLEARRLTLQPGEVRRL